MKRALPWHTHPPSMDCSKMPYVAELITNIRGRIYENAYLGGSWQTFAQEFDGVTEGHAVLLDDPIDGTAADPAAEAVSQVLAGRHHQAGGDVGVKRTAAYEVFARLLQGHPRGLDQALDRYFAL